MVHPFVVIPNGPSLEELQEAFSDGLCAKLEAQNQVHKKYCAWCDSTPVLFLPFCTRLNNLLRPHSGAEVSKFYRQTPFPHPSSKSLLE